jgi:hypothetical protein
MMDAKDISRSVPCDNPFLEELDSILTDPKLKRRLRSSPLDGINVRDLSTCRRHDLLDQMQGELFVPSLTSLDCTSRLFRMIRKGYISRNPTLAENKRTSMVISRMAGQEIQRIPWLPNFALGMRLIGITGVGKTYELRRALQQLTPCIEHGKNQTADWTHYYQAPALYVGMSHDGSLGGLLLNILVALDAAIYTDYSSDRKITKLSNEKLAVHVGIILANHAVGVLIIDEIQHENFSDGVRGDLARTFFLRLLNFGIPMVLVGNPLGMQFLNFHSQDLRRLSSCGTIDMQPFEVDDTNYVNYLAPAFWNYNVLPEPPELDGQELELMYKYSGGIRDFACRIVIGAQRIALEAGHSHLTKIHLEQAFEGPDFSNEERLIIRSFVNKDALSLCQFKDIPWEDYANAWGNSQHREDAVPSDAAPETTTPPSEASEKKTKPRTYPQRTAENIARTRTKRQKQQAKIEKVQATLDAADMRLSGIKEVLIDGLEAACAADQ